MPAPIVKQPVGHPSPLTQGEFSLDGKVYSVDRFAAVHPGGPSVVDAAARGRDVTALYYSHHRLSQKATHSALKRFEVRDAPATVPSYLGKISPEYEELRRRVYRRLAADGHGRGEATSGWWAKVGLLWACTLATEAFIYGLVTGEHQFSVGTATALGLLYALIGLNIQHDANHFAVSTKAIVNRGLGYTLDYIGGSSFLWFHQHTKHHVYTNLYGKDPDHSDGTIRFSALSAWRKEHLWQHIWVWPALLLASAAWIIAYVADLLSGIHKGSPLPSGTPFNRAERYIALGLRLLFLIKFAFLPVLLTGSLASVIYPAITAAVGGGYLALNFIVSHNFVGCHTADSEGNSINSVSGPKGGPRSWAEMQVLASCSVGGDILCWLHGGLNYQIEHHLFPRVSHAHYPVVAPIVRQWCSENGFQYTHFSWLSQSCLSTLQSLRTYGKNTAKVSH